jgi:hypothetical protein
MRRAFLLGTASGENNGVSTGSRKFEKASSELKGFAQVLFTAVV